MDDVVLGSHLDLPSGGTVEFVDIDDLTGAHLHAMRATIKGADSAGETGNALFAKVIVLTVKSWDVPYLADPRTPEANPVAYRWLKFRDLLAIERHVQPVLALLNESIPGDAASPPRPDSE